MTLRMSHYRWILRPCASTTKFQHHNGHQGNLLVPNLGAGHGITPPIPGITSVRAEEEDDDKDADNKQEEAPRQLADRAESTASSQPLLLVRESPPQEAENGEPFVLLEEDNSAEDVDWIGEVDATISDSASDIEAGEAVDNSLVNTDAGSREAKHQERMDAAIAALKSAWATHCTCGKAHHDLPRRYYILLIICDYVEEPAHCSDETEYSLAEMTRFWQRQVSPPFAPPGITNFPLDMPKMCSRNDNSNDFRNVPWRPLLAGERRPSEAKQSRFQGTDRDIDRRWDVDSFIARVTTLAVHRGGFDLAYRPPFLRRITQNQRVRINGHHIHKLKQLRLGCRPGCGWF
ncbi:hypothetical protein H2199_000587 [Coniosporium tulheliwenetii]|uniref:Uncharacterized protein n=1 Tax=Coniosporium tulheliwenetii TaxID=3383036 RepID=A0ACC2ZQM3_9PEZI|nr:hypothetical protein H2199_000587 [Cladosporium sp. JES 115]